MNYLIRKAVTSDMGQVLNLITELSATMRTSLVNILEILY